MKSFARGLKLEGRKQATENLAIINVPAPRKVIIPLQQNLGCPCEPWVKVGELVAEGQKIADSPKMISAPLHATISGKITRIEKLPNACNYDVPSIVIEAEEGLKSEAQFASQWTADELQPAQLKKIIREAGIVGLGGAAFPTHVKLSPPPDKIISTIIINGCECEPYITSDERLMIERPEDILAGAKAIAKAVGATRIIVGVEESKREAVKKLKAESCKQKAVSRVEVISLKTKYPQGGEKMLIKALLGKEVPSGCLPLDVGVVVNNVGTAVAVADAVKLGKPLIKRVVTVTGSGIKRPQNIYTRLGVTFGELIGHCGGLTDDAAKVIMGGPMTGLSVSSLDLPVVKATNCLLVLNRREAKVFEEQSCIRCGRCLKACPVGLMPNYIADGAKLKNWDRTEEYHVADCIECGCCSYVCPSRIYLVQYFKVAKQELQLRRKLCQ